MMTNRTTRTKVQPQNRELKATSTEAPVEMMAEAMLQEGGDGSEPSQPVAETSVALPTNPQLFSASPNTAVVAGGTVGAVACCGAEKQQSCCAPSAKATCCGAQAASGSCGCK